MPQKTHWIARAGGVNEEVTTYYRAGDFAVDHRADGDPQYPGAYVVTHAPTGRHLTDYPRAAVARALARHMAAVIPMVAPGRYHVGEDVTPAQREAFWSAFATFVVPGSALAHSGCAPAHRLCPLHT